MPLEQRFDLHLARLDVEARRVRSQTRQSLLLLGDRPRPWVALPVMVALGVVSVVVALRFAADREAASDMPVDSVRVEDLVGNGDLMLVIDIAVGACFSGVSDTRCLA